MAAALIVALAGCGGTDPTGPSGIWDPTFRPGPASAFQPSQRYWNEWWPEVGRCVRPDDPPDYADFVLIRWFSVPGESFWTPDHGMASGRWVPENDIYLAQASLNVSSVVKHEMVHALLQPGEADDPRFLECSGIPHT